MSVVKAVGPKRHLWSSKEYYRLFEAGFFRHRRVQLIEGVIFEMPAQKNLHALSIELSRSALELAFGPGFWIRVQMSLDLSPHSVPDPDIAVVQGNPRDFKSDDNPTSALLTVEVSDTTLRFDQYRKASLYARAGISDYWIVDLVHQRLEVRRNPIPDSSQPFGYGYASVTILTAADSVSPLHVPQATILVADLLP